MRVLVTGANGLVGGRVCALLSGEHSVTGVSLGARRVAGAWNYASADLAVASDVERLFEELRPEAVIHCAAATDVDWCEKNPDGAQAMNVGATTHVASGVRACGAHLVHVSTDYVFDGQSGPYREDDRVNPRGVYATTKDVAEQRVREIAGSWAIARPSWVYGWPPARKHNFGSWLVSTLARGEPVRLFEDQFGSPSHASSVAAMLAELATRRLGGVWNTCGADVVSRVTFGERLCAVFGFDPTLIVRTRLADSGLTAPRPRLGGLRVDKALAQLEAKPLALDEALRRFQDEYRAAAQLA